MAKESAPPATPPAKKGAKETEYLVLRKLEGHDDGWTPVGKASAHTKVAACKAVAKKLAATDDRPVSDVPPPEPRPEFAEGQFRAIPAASWKDDPDISIRNHLRYVPDIQETAASARPRKVAAAASGVASS